MKLVNVKIAKPVKRSTGLDFVDHVLDGGLVKGQTVLLSGASGSGRTTLVLQIAMSYVNRLRRTNPVSALYVAANDQVEYIKLKMNRLGRVPQHPARLLSCISDDRLESFVRDMSEYDLVIVDSIRGVKASRYEPGSVNGMTKVVETLVNKAKNNGHTLILINGIDSNGESFGHARIQHSVDTTILLDKAVRKDERVLRCEFKNRYGETQKKSLVTLSEKGFI